MTINTTHLVQLGELAAEAYDECDTALGQLQESFGAPYEAAKDNLLRDVRLAETEGTDLSVFSGSDSRFKFPKFTTNIVVRVRRTATPHSKLDILTARIERLERDLKLAKINLKHETEKLITKGECDEVTENVTLAFQRLNK